ncbi:MAG: phosphate-starvation-inducible PsiE family protein [bacterium]|nr:phosphate-starvation-inducible PsiE family protein [bacterium]
MPKGIIHKFEWFIVLALLIMMMLALLASTVELAIILVEQLLAPPRLLLDVDEMLTVFAFFLMVLIGLELVETIKMYLDENVFHVEVVVLVAIIAVARKIIIIDYGAVSYEILLSIAALIIALSAGYFLLKRATMPSKSEKLGDDSEHAP